ncbi:MAG: hypothetical protein FJ087_13005, partial [Deltaproteobacteria bacterium]|nr:hypothetical protein [Deltaproteobacteria bacterium]
AQDENEAWSELAGALVRRFGVDIPKPTFSGDEDSEAWLSWFLVELIRVGCLDAAVVQRGMRLRNIRMTRFADGAELARSWGEVHRRLYPYFDALKRSGNVPDDAPFLGGFDPQWLPLRDETHLWSVTREVFPQSVQPGIVREALNDALNQPALEEALDRALSVHGIAPPEDRARLRGLWSGCLRGVARTVEGVAALAAATEDMLKGVSDSYSLWRSNLDHAVALVLDGIEDLPAFTTWGLADLLRLNRFGEDDALAGPEAALHLVCEGARARYPERFEELLAQERRPFVVLGNRYPTKEAAQEALEERRAELQPPLVAAAQEFRRPAQSASTNPRGEERGSKARVVRFSPRAGLLGREGEEYLLRHMKDGMCLPVPSACDLRAFDVSTREEAERTSAIAEVREWLSQAGVVEPSVTPGFDVLATYLSGGRRLWDGIEVKTSSDHEASVIRVNMTENEWIAARREGGEGSWPIDTYRVCCILRFFSVDRDRTLLVPRVVWMPDPAALAKARSIDVEKVNSPARYTISAVLADAATAPT